MRYLLLALGLSVGTQGSLVAQAGPTPPPSQPFDLATLFDIGALVLDENGDSVPDFVNASLILGASPSGAELRAATEVTARLGFETMAMDLPVARGVPAATDGSIGVIIGRGGLSEVGLTAPGIDPTSLDSGEGAVVTRSVDGGRWLIVVGGDDDGLMTAARIFAGALPHTQTLSTPHLSEIREDLLAAVDSAGLSGAALSMREARAREASRGVHRLVVELRVQEGDVTAAAEAVRMFATPDSGATPTYRGLESLEVRVLAAGGEDGPGPVVRIDTAPPPDAPGPISGRPGRGTKADLDLSSIYSNDGLLGDSDNNEIPDRVDALLVAGSGGTDLLPELGGRLGLESTGLVLPLTASADGLDRPGSQPTTVLLGSDNVLSRQLADSGSVDLDVLQPGQGLIQLVPKAFGEKPSLVVSGGDEDGARRAAEQVALTFPHISESGKDRPTIDDVEYGLWSTLSGHSPAGQAAIALYKLDQIVEQLADEDLATADVLVSIEKPDPGFEVLLRDRAAALGADALTIEIDDRDVRNAATILEEDVTIPGEVERFWSLFRSRVLPAVARAQPVRIEARLSEPPAIRRAIEQEVRSELARAGADPERIEVTVLSAFKQGFSWLDESVRPRIEGRELGSILIRFRRNEPPEEWPQQAMYTPVRWLHEIYPIDEILARDLELDPERITFEETTEGPTYEVVVTDAQGGTLLTESFDPRWVLRPYFDRFADYEHVRVTTGWLEAQSGGRTLLSERIVTDPEWFWDYFQANTLTALYDHVMKVHEGIPRGGSVDAPFFGELSVELELSEPDYLLDLDKELISPMDAVHEEIYFGTIELFHLLGRNSRGQDLTHPGRVIPIMRPKQDGGSGRARIKLTGFQTSRPAVVVRYEGRSGDTGEVRLDIPKVNIPRPSARRALVERGTPGLSRLDLRVRVDTDADEREQHLQLATHEQVDQSMISAEMVEATLTNLSTMRAGGLYRSALAFPGLGEIGVWAEWTHEQDPESRRTIVLPDNGSPNPLPDWRTLVEDGWTYAGQRIVQWDTPIPPPEGHRMLAEMAMSFDEATMYRAGRSYLGRDIWALDLMSPVSTTHWSHAKATTFKPTVIYSARQHANEVSSTSHVLRHAELLLTDPEQKKKLERANVIVHPFTNPDGAQLAYDLYEITPEFILHAGYLGSLGMDATSGGGDDHPIYPESRVRGELWSMWLPDIFLNPHGYPSHQVVQLFSEYTGLVRRGRVTERNWGFNKGWFMPGFGYIDDPRFPRHKDAAFKLRDYITQGINSNRDVFDMNQRNYARYRRYGEAFDPDVFRLPMSDSVLIQMPLKGSRGQTGGRGYNPNVTIWSGTTEAPDETAHGDWMKLVAKAGLSWDQAILDYLYDGDHEVKRSGSTFFGGVSLKMNRPRPPEEKDDDEDPETVSEPDPRGGSSSF